MFFELSIAIVVGAISSYFCFFNPALLSKNIIELQSSKLKWAASVFSILCTIALLFLETSEANSRWLEFGFFIVLYFISITDLYSKIIPNKLVLLLLVLSIIQLVLHFDIEKIVPFGLLTVLLIALNFLANKYFEKLLFGWGDIKLIGVLSLSLGWGILWVIYIALISGGLLSIFGIASKKISRDSKIPFAIFLFIALIFFDSGLLQSILQLIS